MKRYARYITTLICAVALLTFIPVVTYADDVAEESAETLNYVSITITRETFFSFTPNATGYWTFATSDQGEDSAPEIAVINHYGHELGWDRGDNAVVKLHLVEGAPYVIRAGFERGTRGIYNLIVFMSEEFEPPGWTRPELTQIPGSGGVMRGTGDIFYSFTPDETGLWEIHATRYGLSVELYITDNRDNFVAFPLDTFGPEFNATIQLTAGEEYIINGTGGWGAGYVLTVSPTDSFEAWIDWEMLAQWGFAVDLDGERTELDPTGSASMVTEMTHFSFTPDETGLWSFAMTNVTEWAWILVTDNYGSFLSFQEAGAWWDSHMALYLAEGVEYVIWANNEWYEGNRFDLTIMPYIGLPIIDWEPEWDEWDWVTSMPSEGGSFSLEEHNGFIFSPDATGSWTFHISGEWDDIQYWRSWRELAISDTSDSFWIDEWESGMITLHLAADVEYHIEAWVSWDILNPVLLVSPTYIFNGNGIRRVVEEAEFVFTPDETGYWVIYTSGAVGATDPFLWLLDAEGNELAQDDDGGEGLNALIKIRLEAGVEYVIRAGFFAGVGEYMLNVARAAGIQARPRLTVLEPPARRP
ncbi:MAG: hypothetical protein FWC73_12550 [Defluviitaleaceae bacterium]|nr:hypothetical protein [Defluviitaleaceae bacterium]